MPELPEVEVIAHRLRSGNKREQKLVGRTVKHAQLSSKSTVKEPKSPSQFAQQIEGAKFVDVKRRAKHLLLQTDRGTLLVHLRLTGDLHVLAPEADEPKFVRVRLDLDDDGALVFVDGRHLGEMRFVSDPSAHLEELGPEPLSDAFTVDALAAVMKGKRAVKAVLLDQRAVAGVGNIYSDEACWYAKIWPGTVASKLTRDDVKRLHAGVKKALQKSIDELMQEDAHIEWRYSNRGEKSPFNVYDRAGEPCLRCKTKLVASKIAGRTSVVCPKCQPKKPAATKEPKRAAKTTRAARVSTQKSNARDR